MHKAERKVRGFQEWQPAFARSHIHTVGNPDATKHSETYQESMRNTATVDGHKLKLEMLLQGAPIEHRPDWLSTECATEHTWPLRDVPLEGTPTTLEARGTCQPKKKLPWEEIG